MQTAANRWALILAAGAGTRLSGLTNSRGSAGVPKQFWSLTGGASLLEETLQRAHSVTAASRVAVVVAAEHRAHWRGTLAGLPSENVIVQPRDRGTAIGILLGVAAIMRRNPEATVLVLPSDHFVQQEGVLRRSVLKTFASVRPEAGMISLLGIKPESADTELGYIVRGAPDRDGGYRINTFVEKPGGKHARDLIRRSALWNSFILIARARAFVELIGQRYPGEVEEFLETVSRHASPSLGSRALDRLYEQLPSLDFSRDIVEGSEEKLKVVPVPACGWSDLGTPQRVAAALDGLNGHVLDGQTAHPSLADAHSRFIQMEPAIG